MYRRRQDEEYEYLKERALFCLVMHQSPDTYDNMTAKEISAWWAAWRLTQPKK